MRPACSTSRKRQNFATGPLYLPWGALRFASRHAFGLAYQSQRETPSSRATNRAFKLRRKLGSSGGIRKPKGMHRRTFARERARVEEAETLANGYTALLV